MTVNIYANFYLRKFFIAYFLIQKNKNSSAAGRSSGTPFLKHGVSLFSHKIPEQVREVRK
jgi:hypothetical protein